MTGVKPSFSTTVGGSVITIVGTHFVTSRSNPLECVFGGESKVDAVLVSSEEVLCVVPAHDQGPVSLALEIRGLSGLPRNVSVFMYVSV